jgi:hypothetical protein
VAIVEGPQHALMRQQSIKQPHCPRKGCMPWMWAWHAADAGWVGERCMRACSCHAIVF